MSTPNESLLLQRTARGLDDSGDNIDTLERNMVQEMQNFEDVCMCVYMHFSTCVVSPGIPSDEEMKVTS